MPNISGMNVSDETPLKHQTFEAIFRMHISVTKKIKGRHSYWLDARQPYVYVDLNAGCGEYEVGGRRDRTSGLIAVQNLSRMNPPMDYEAVLIDCEPASADALQRHADINFRNHIRVICGDNRAVMPTVSLPPAFGLVYSDPNTLMLDLDLLGTLAGRPEFKRVDFLLFLSGANDKRVRLSQGGEPLESRLYQLKPNWLIQRPFGKFQKTFLLGSNWDGFKDYRKLNFARVDTPEGREYMERVSMTKAERFLAQQPAMVQP